MAPTSHSLPAVARMRRGTVYVAVLGVSLIVGIIALAAMHLSLVETRALAGGEDMTRAELLAQSAVELAVKRINANDLWRLTYVSGLQEPSVGWISLGQGEMRFMLVDPIDGNFANGGDVVIWGLGAFNGALQCLSVAATANGNDVALQPGTWTRQAAP